MPPRPVEGLEPRLLLAAAPRFITPLAGVPNIDWAIANYVDRDPSAGILDYRGGAITYDGHAGIDFALPNFASMDRGVPVYAAAPGTVIAVHDGEFDRQTKQLTPAPPANYVVIDHGNGYVSRYYHLRRGSVAVSVGQTVAAGKQIGLVGSSGFADGPHLHFEVAHNGAIVDTYANPTLYWANPLPYAGDVHGVLDHGVTNYNPFNAPASDPYNSDAAEHPSDVSTFKQSTSVTPYAWLQLHDIKAGDKLDFDWYRPSGALQTTQHFTAATSYPIGNWYAYVQLGANAAAGSWHVAARWNGVEVARDAFAVTAAGAPEAKLSQGATYVLDGRTTPIDFGTATTSAGKSLTFTLLNHGSAPLAVSGVKLPASYALTDAPASSIAPGASDTFTVRLGGPGVANAAYAGSIVVHTNDSSEAKYNFNVTGRVNAAPATPPPDTRRPTAKLASAPRLNTRGQVDYRFTVTYADNVAVVPTTMDVSDLRVTGPMTFDRPAELVSVNRYKSGTPRTATYRVRPPDDNTWIRYNNGTYTLTMQPNQVADTSHNPVAPGVLGTFLVRIPKLVTATVILPTYVVTSGLSAPDTKSVWDDGANDV